MYIVVIVHIVHCMYSVYVYVYAYIYFLYRMLSVAFDNLK